MGQIDFIMKKNKRKIVVVFAGVLLVVLPAVFLLPGYIVKKYYKISIPEPSRVVESVRSFSRKALDPDSIRLLNWNVYKGKRAGWKDDFQTLSRDMDLILVQEAYMLRHDFRRFRVKGMGLEFARSFSCNARYLSDTGVMTLSRACPVTVKYLRSRYREPVVNTPKMSLFTEYSLDNSDFTLLVVNTHGINFVRPEIFKSQISALVKEIKGHWGPVIFAGDFNTWTGKKLGFLLRIVKGSGMQEVMFKPDARTKRFKCAIDHVFYSGLKILKSRVIGDITSSDHKAMEVEFCLDYHESEK